MKNRSETIHEFVERLKVGTSTSVRRECRDERTEVEQGK